jgi:hypothetical protein
VPCRAHQYSQTHVDPLFWPSRRRHANADDKSADRRA